MLTEPTAPTVITSESEEELCDIGSRLFSPHHLRFSRRGRGTIGACDLGGISVTRIRYGTEASVVTTRPIDYYSVQLPITGQGTVRFRAETVLTQRTRGAVFNPGDSVSMRFESDVDRIAVKLPVAVVTRHLAMLLGRPVEAQLRFHHASTTAFTPWASVLYLLEREVAPLGRETIRQPLAMRIVDAFLTSLLVAQPHNWSTRLHEAPTSDPDAVYRVVGRIQAEPQLSWTLSEMSETAGIGGRALQSAFRKETGMTPTRYLREVRLRHCYEQLSNGAHADVSISDLAASSGFTHFGRFARSFRERYGILPSEVRRSSAGGPRLTARDPG